MLPHKTQNGFTLFELLVSVVLLGMVSVMIYSVLNVGIKFSDQGEKRILAIAREQGLLSLVHRQIKSALYDKGKKGVILSADDTTLRVVTMAPLIYRSAGIVLAVYRFVEGEGVVYYQEKRDYYNIDYDEDYTPDIEDMAILLNDVTSFSASVEEESGVVTVLFGDKEYEFSPRCGIDVSY
ncbi:MAG: prepilin-type N-terminal cleavage/methylation domain-containing protein [Desulfobulbaceae bacterium]|nr:prepilin-type N-terminal cleavage/methylation domain-containing protein [Desulfobulbaceae bacterium]